MILGTVQYAVACFGTTPSKQAVEMNGQVEEVRKDDAAVLNKKKESAGFVGKECDEIAVPIERSQMENPCEIHYVQKNGETQHSIVIALEYDNDGKLISEEIPLPEMLGPRSLQYSYNKEGQLEEKRVEINARYMSRPYVVEFYNDLTSMEKMERKGIVAECRELSDGIEITKRYFKKNGGGERLKERYTLNKEKQIVELEYNFNEDGVNGDKTFLWKVSYNGAGKMEKIVKEEYGKEVIRYYYIYRKQDEKIEKVLIERQNESANSEWEKKEERIYHYNSDGNLVRLVLISLSQEIEFRYQCEEEGKPDGAEQVKLHSLRKGAFWNVHRNRECPWNMGFWFYFWGHDDDRYCEP
jgi:hypothetical protein